eukprot:m.808570 g.808570  ORF g.808570 m.808570 type:complete len:62 (+) comp59312_c0_seq2:1174-1359(+)
MRKAFAWSVLCVVDAAWNAQFKSGRIPAPVPRVLIVLRSGFLLRQERNSNVFFVSLPFLWW